MLRHFVTLLGQSSPTLGRSKIYIVACIPFSREIKSDHLKADREWKTNLVEKELFVPTRTYLNN